MNLNDYADLIGRFHAALAEGDDDALRRMTTTSLFEHLRHEERPLVFPTGRINVSGIEVEGNGRVVDVTYSVDDHDSFVLALLDEEGQPRIVDLPRRRRGVRR